MLGRLEKYKRIKKNEIRNEIIYLLLLIIVTGSVLIYVLNIIIANQLINQIRSEDINYELFREMKISEELLDFIYSEDEKENNINAKYDKYDILTLFMILNDYNTLDFKKIKKTNVDMILESLIYDLNFRKIKNYYYSVLYDIKKFPVYQKDKENPVISYENTWKAHRSYGGDRYHEGTDLMVIDNHRGKHKTLSMTAGLIEKIGWLEQGGYRIGVRSPTGAYFYYAHLDSYGKEFKEGDFVEVGEFLGYVGDSGYGPSGTRGKFNVHLHLGLYIGTNQEEISVNPYYILKHIEKNEIP